MKTMSENDVKIYVGNTKSEKTGSELKSVFDTVMSHRSNGNIDKAKALGTTLASIEPLGDGALSLKLKDKLPQKFLLQDILYQIKVLIVFACEAMLQISIPNDLLTTTAVTAMYSEIEKQSPALYTNISGGTAFTFYFLALQKGGKDISLSIGETFAMLCSVKNKEGFVAAGKDIWELAVEIIEKEIEKAEFTY